MTGDGECCQEQRLLDEEVEEQQAAAAERAKTISHWDLGGEVFRKKNRGWNMEPATSVCQIFKFYN